MTIRRLDKVNTKKVLSLILITVLVASFFVTLIPTVHASSGISLVQGACNGLSSSGAVSVTLSNTPQNGDVLFAVVSTIDAGATATVSSATETGVTWHYIVSATGGSSYWDDIEIWLGVVGSGASTSVTISFTNAYWDAIADICEYSGVATSGYLDKTAIDSGFGTTTSSGTTATTASADELWIGGILSEHNAQSTPTNGFTLFDGQNPINFASSYLQYIASSIGAANTGTTISGSSQGWCGCIATFFSSSYSPPPTVILNSPASGTAYAHDPVAFSFTPEYAASAQLWMNISGTWQRVASTSTITNGQQNRINYSMPQNSNSYIWNVKVTNTVGNAFAPSNFVITDSSLGSGMALTVDGSNLLNSAGDVVNARSVGVAGFAPDLIFWTSSGSDSWSDQWQAANSAAVTQTLEELSTVWHVNMIRFFIFAEWWWLGTVTPSVESGSGYSSTPVNVRTWLETFASECASYDIYVDICTYSLTAASDSFSGDPYAGTGAGIPLTGTWDPEGTAFLTAEGYGSNEQGFWTAYWQSMADAFKSYPNVIFEAWNEPFTGSNDNVIVSGYLTYLTTMYEAVRATGATNLIMMQWNSGWEPNVGINLSWASQIASAIADPSNLIFTTHLYYYAPYDITPQWDQNGIDNNAGGVPMTTSQLEAQLQGAVNSMGVNAPLVVNEEGDCSADTANITSDYVWWNNLLQAQDALGIGEGAYYWLSSSGLGGYPYSGEELLTSGYTPNSVGQDYINAYTAPPPTPTPTPSQTPTPLQTSNVLEIILFSLAVLIVCASTIILYKKKIGAKISQVIKNYNLEIFSNNC